jgi:hypothetical protein
MPVFLNHYFQHSSRSPDHMQILYYLCSYNFIPLLALIIRIYCIIVLLSLRLKFLQWWWLTFWLSGLCDHVGRWEVTFQRKIMSPASGRWKQYFSYGCCSPWWSLVSFLIACHWSRFCDFHLQFLTPIVFRSSSTESSHLTAGLPSRWMPSGLYRVNFMEAVCSKTLVPTYWTTWHYNTEDHSVNDFSSYLKPHTHSCWENVSNIFPRQFWHIHLIHKMCFW